MRTLYLLKSLFLLLVLIVESTSMWATPTTYSFSSIPTTGWNINGGSQTINGVSWTYSACTYINGGIQVGSANGPQTTDWTIQTPISSFGGNKVVTAVSITAQTKALTATYDISVGGSSVKSGSLSTTSTTYKAEGLNITTGDIIITLKGSSTSKAMYLTNVSVTYDDAPVTPSYTISAISNNTDYGTVSVSGNKITATPATGYRVSTTTPYEVTSGEATVTQNGNEFTVTASADCTVRINFEAIPTYTVTWKVNGATVHTDNYEEGSAVVFPTDPAAINGKIFVGWTTTEITGIANEAPTLVTSATMETTAQTYFAVFAKKTAGHVVTYTDELTQSWTGVSGDYSNWSDKSCTGGSSAVYAGNSDDGGTTKTIQLRSTENSGIVTTTSGGKLKRITVEWYSSSTQNGRSLDIYGKNTAYSAPSDLYNSSNQGTYLGSINYGSNAPLTITGDYAYIGLRSNNGTIYLNKISIEWETVMPDTYSGYFTTYPNTISVTVGGKGFATLACDYALDFTDKSIKAYTITSTDGSTLTLTQKNLVAEDEPVLLYSATANDSQDIPIIAEATADTNNKLVKGIGTAITWSDTEKVYILYTGGENPGFYRANNSSVATNKAYLDLTTLNADARSFTLDFDEETTGVADVRSKMDDVRGKVFDLQGRRVAQPQKGLYIQNGRKVVIK